MTDQILGTANEHPTGSSGQSGWVESSSGSRRVPVSPCQVGEDGGLPVETSGITRCRVGIHIMLDEGGRTIAQGSVIVQKFGGSSLVDPSGILRAAERIAKTRENGFQVVAVVSAMGDTTDELCDLAAEVSSRPRPSDLDALLSTGELVSSALLAIALADRGHAPVTFTGSKAGLITDDVHGKAQITDVRPERIRASLARGEIPIVAGFQGRTRKGKRVTTLGRGGSDLTAVALAAALGAGICEIYTDVDGVYTADPRVVPRARKLGVLSSEVMLEFAASGCKVLHLRCVEYARRFGIPIHVRSSFVPDLGTLVLPGLDSHPFREPSREQPIVTGVASVDSAVKVSVIGVPDAPESMARMFQVLSHSGVSVQTIVQNAVSSGSARYDVALILPSPQAPPALSVLSAAQGSIGFQSLRHDGRVGRVSVTGVGMRSSPGVFCTFLRTLAEAGIDLDLVEISETCVAAITRAERLEDAERAVRMAFGMDPAAVQGPAFVHGTRSRPPSDQELGDLRWSHGLRGLAPCPASRGG
ncbi:aspartate kinase [uncultured Arthrobacter sp.]|uniref:aspartate kinase n=1 Tax=uncultured Arthrobacter sp. TaxID=114050 RepID=UPI00321792BF